MLRDASFTPLTKKLYHVLTQPMNGKVWMFGQGYNEQTYNLPNAAAHFDLGKPKSEPKLQCAVMSKFIYCSCWIATATEFKILDSSRCSRMETRNCAFEST